MKGRVKKADFQFLIDKMQAKLSGWKGKLLNRVSFVTLAKTALTVMPIYHMQIGWVS